MHIRRFNRDAPEPYDPRYAARLERILSVQLQVFGDAAA